MNKNDSIFQMSYDNLLDAIIPGISTDWLYKSIYRAENSPAALRDIINPIDDEVTCGCFIMDLMLTYGEPEYQAIEPGQVLLMKANDNLDFFVVNALTGAITITPQQRYEKGFMIQKGKVNPDGRVAYGDIQRGYVVGYPDRNEDEFEVVDIQSGERFPVDSFSYAETLCVTDDVMESIYNGNKKIIDSAVAVIPDLITDIYDQLQFYKPFINVMNDGFTNTKGGRTAVQGELQALKEHLELMMPAMYLCNCFEAKSE